MGLPNTLVDGNTASATPVNENFVYLDERITSTSSSLDLQVNSVQSSLSTVNSECVHKTGTETISGNKTFSAGVYVTGALTAPTVATSDNSTKAATTAWVKSALPSILGSITSASNGGVKLANGLIVEWATFATTSDTSKTWNFKNSFTSSSSYAVASAKVGTNEFNYSPGISYTSGGSCKVYINSDTARLIAVGY